MEGIQGAVLQTKLRHLTRWNAARARHAEYYQKLLSHLTGINLPTTENRDSHVWHLFVVLVREIARDDLQQLLADQGIVSAVHYPTPIHLQPAYAHLGYRPGDFPVAEDVAGHCLSLPIYPEMDRGQVEFVASAVARAMETGKSTLPRAA